MNEKNFGDWLIKFESKSPGTANGYTSAIRGLSEHLSVIKGESLDLFTVKDADTIESLFEQYDIGGRYETIGLKGNRTYINGLRAYARFLRNTPKSTHVRRTQVDRNRTKGTSDNQILSTFNLTDHFSNELVREMETLTPYYQQFYCLERSLRQMIAEVMEDVFGKQWWRMIDTKVASNVARNLEYELDTTHTKRSDNKIDYTTFGDLRKIINQHWEHFAPRFNRNLNSVNEVLIDLNRLRVPIAHCTPLAPKEMHRMQIRMDDWFDLLNTDSN